MIALLLALSLSVPSPNAIEVGGQIAACMTAARVYAEGQGVEVHGNVFRVTLVDQYAFATVTATPEGAVLEALPAMDAEYAREAMRYALSCAP